VEAMPDAKQVSYKSQRCKL